MTRVYVGRKQKQTNLYIWTLTIGEDTLLHGEALLVVAAGDSDDVALPVITEQVGFDFGAHTLLIEDSKLVLIDDFEELLTASRRERNV
jgi:hypothetical protein